MALSKFNRYSQVKLNGCEYELLKQFSTELGISQSALLRLIVRKYLPLEVNDYLDKKENKYEKTI